MISELLARLADGDEEANESLLELAARGELTFPSEVDPDVVARLGGRFVREPLLIRMGLFFCLKALGPRAAPALPGLLEALEDPRNDCRTQAAELIAELGEHSRPGAAELLEALQDEGREDVRDWVALALARSGADLTGLEDHPSPYVREGVRLANAQRNK